MIPLNKSSGVRPTGGGEVLRRIIGKVIGWILMGNVQEVACLLQTVTGLQGVAETATHVMKNIFKDDEAEAVILVDATLHKR